MAETWYGVSKVVASNVTWACFNLAYIGILVLPWLNLSHTNTAKADYART